jgi:hypothetical protein
MCIYKHALHVYTYVYEYSYFQVGPGNMTDMCTSLIIYMHTLSMKNFGPFENKLQK